MSGDLSYASTLETYTDAAVYDESEKAVTYLNTIRDIVGLSPIVKNEKLKEMADFHSKYMNYNKLVSSIEESDLEFFRGRYPWDRAAYFNYEPSYIYEFSKEGYTNFEEGMKALINDPISRSIILDPVYTDIGMANDGSYYSFEFGGDSTISNLFFNYPNVNQYNIPTVWANADYELYYKDIDGLPDEVGVPITVTHYGAEGYTYKDISVSMTNIDTGEEVPFIISEPGENYLLSNTLTILPLVKYDKNTQYQMDIRFSYEVMEGIRIIEKSFMKLYSFTTEQNFPTTVTSPYMTRGMFTEMLVRELVRSQGSEYQLIEPLEARFNDVGINHSQSIYIYTASTEGLISGFPDNEFKPELNITKEQAYTILVKGYEKVNGSIVLPETDQLSFYSDYLTVSSWAYTNVQKAVELGIILDPNYMIKPGDYLTEDDFDLILSLYQKVIKDPPNLEEN